MKIVTAEGKEMMPWVYTLYICMLFSLLLFGFIGWGGYKAFSRIAVLEAQVEYLTKTPKVPVLYDI